MAIYVDLDGTLAKYEGWVNINHIGDPIPVMVMRVRRWLFEGRVVKIFTARMSRLTSPDPEARAEGRLAEKRIQEWCVKYFGVPLEVTCIKGFDGEEFWDDRAVSVETNTGRIIKREEK